MNQLSFGERFPAYVTPDAARAALILSVRMRLRKMIERGDWNAATAATRRLDALRKVRP